MIRKGKVVSGDITPGEMRNSNVVVTLGTGIAPFIWMMDRIEKDAKEELVLIYCNSHKDEMYHQTLLPDLESKTKNYQEKLSCTREEGLKMGDLIESCSPVIKDMVKSKGIGNCRVFFCGPKQLQSTLAHLLVKMLEISFDELSKSKMIVY